MLTGAFFAVAVDLAAHNVWLAVLASMVAGGLMALIHAVVSIRYRADQIVSGVAINIFAAGITVFLVNRLYGLADVGQVAARDSLPNWNIPLLGAIPFLGRVFFQQNIMVYIALLVLLGTQVLLFRTRLGLRLRSVGEHPQADAQIGAAGRAADIAAIDQLQPVQDTNGALLLRHRVHLDVALQVEPGCKTVFARDAGLCVVQAQLLR